MGSTSNLEGERPFRVAISPLAWTNDVLEDLGGDTPVEQCLTEAQAAGYEGTEMGRKFPREPEVLGPLLDRYQLKLASGWYSGFLAVRDVGTEMEAVAQHAKLLMRLGARVMVYGECGKMVPNAPLDAPMSARLTLQSDEFRFYADRLTEFARGIEGEFGLRLAYHHHLMMVAETLDEVSTLFDRAGTAVGLLLDTGHAAGAGFDYGRLLDRFGDRIVHIHLKDVRADVMRKVRDGDLSFNDGVRAGMFTIPGDGLVDFSGVADFVRKTRYAGWLVVEAEQDPVKAPPLETVSRARRFIASLF
jgi:inosose dehydratase